MTKLNQIIKESEEETLVNISEDISYLKEAGVDKHGGILLSYIDVQNVMFFKHLHSHTNRLLQGVVEDIAAMKKTDKFPQSLTTFDGTVKYFDRLSDGDIHYNRAVSDLTTLLEQAIKENHD